MIIMDTMIQRHIRHNRGTVQVVASKESLPLVLREAVADVGSGRIDRVKACLNDQAIESLCQGFTQDPESAYAMFVIGWLFYQMGRSDKAEYWYRRSIQNQPHALALQQLGRLCRLSGRYCEATQLRKQALDLDPDNVELMISWALDLIREGKIDQGITALRQTVALDPGHADAHSKLLFHLHYLPDQDRSALLEEHKRWGRRHAPCHRAKTSHNNDPNPTRPLRIGYLSADFKQHSVAYTFEPILNGHDREHFKIYGYGNVPHPDAVTDRLMGKFDVYRDVWGREDTAVARLIEQDKIDILLAIGGHTGHHRLSVLGYKPAPLQADFQGINTTGIAQVDYRFTDEFLDPPGSESFYVEQSIYLPDGLHCYAPPSWAPEVGPLPAWDKGFITFGSFNNGMKINEQVLTLWAQILQAVPGSQLLMKLPGGRDPGIQERFLMHFEQCHVARDRIRIYGRVPPEEHLDMYNEIDIALDSFPFNGCMTTLEGLWMGVPTVTRVGQHFVSRETLTILHQVGLDYFATTTHREYVAKATALAHNKQSLATMRASLRSLMASSVLCNHHTYTRHLEDAYRRIWHQWCACQAENMSNHNTTISKAMAISPALSDNQTISFFISENSDLQFRVSKDQLPKRLLEAAAAIEVGQIQRAGELLNEATVRATAILYDKNPSRIDALFMLGMLFSRTEQPQMAEYWFKRVIEHTPHALVFFELGNLCRHTGRLSQALAYHQQAVDLSPDSQELHTILADDFIKTGKTQKGIDILRQVVRHTPDRTNHSKYLWHLHQNPNLDQQMLFEEHRCWGRQHVPVSLARRSHDRDRCPDRRLKIGYISPDFCGHSVAYFFESLLDQHLPDQVESYGYGHVVYQDPVTDRLRQKFDHYTNICGMDDQAVADLIEGDRIDILVDLAGHTGDNRLGVLAYKPAPIQVSFLGYPDTTGMDQVDYRFTDPWADLSDAQRFYTETLVYLDKGFLCYRPPDFAPPVQPLPAEKNDYITYGSFNNNCKINTDMITLWSHILKADSTSRLLIKFSGGDDPGVQQHYRDQFIHNGVDPDRIRIVGRLPVVEHLKLYHQVDVALDTYPYNGTTTICEALWMGVPSISLVGRHHASRVGLSLLSRVGLEVFCASTPDEYVNKAVAYAQERGNLALIRRSLRYMMLSSSLCNAPDYTRTVEAAYRDMWHQWCRCRSEAVKVAPSHVEEH